MSKPHILEHLQSLIKRASDSKAEQLKEAAGVSSKLDSAEDGTSPASTGEMAADQVRAQKEQYAEPAADVNADDNKAGESVEQSTDEATAVATDGQEGTKGGELSAPGIGEADNGPEDTDSPDNNGFNSGAFKTAAAECRKLAEELRKSAEEALPGFDRFLAKAARSSDDEELKKKAMAMPDDELAEAAADSLAAQIEAGEIGEEEAAAILEEAMASGAVTEEDIAEAAEMMGGMPEDDMVGAKLAAADIDPDHPEYLRKLASLYPAEIQAGYAFAMKLAQELVDELPPEEGMPPVEDEVPPEEVLPSVEEEVAPPAAGEETLPPVEEPLAEGGIEEELAGEAPEDEAAAMAAVGDELGLDEATLAELMAAPLPPEEEAALGKIASALKEAGVDAKSRIRTVAIQKVAALRK